MVKICSKCGIKNHEESFWCNNCDNILLKEPVVKQENFLEDHSRQFLEQQNEFKSFDHYENKAIKLFLIGFLIIIVFICIFVYFSITMGSNFNWISCQFNEDFWLRKIRLLPMMVGL